MLAEQTPDPLCPVCSQRIAPSAGLAFLHPDNLIHLACLSTAQRRAQAPASASTASGEPAEAVVSLGRSQARNPTSA